MKITVGIPFYNNEKTLLNAIVSVFAQTHTDWELILIDDGSTDSSLKIAQSIDDPRVKVISDGKHKGLCARLNEIIDLAKGDFIARMDADDIMHPNRLERQLDEFKNNPDLDLVSSGMYAINDLMRPLGMRSFVDIEDTAHNVLRKGLCIHVSVMGKREWFKNNKYDENFVRAEDHELWCRTHKDLKFKRIDEPLMFVTEYDSFSLKKYYQSTKTQRKIFLTYGPKMVGWPYAIYLILESYLKLVIYSIYSLFRMQGKLISKRNKEISLLEQEKAKEILNKVIATSIPRK